MSFETQPGMQCGEFESLLAEAVEGTLSQARMAAFRGHAASCAVCGPELAAATEGYRLLRALPEVESPARLVHNILALTSAQEARQAGPAVKAAPWRERWTQGLVQPWMRAALQPRFTGTLAMAFFSISLLLNATGVRISDLRYVDLRPSSIRDALTRQYYEASARAVQYYDSMRVVYELQSKAQDLKEAVMPEPAAKPDDKQKQDPDKKDKKPGENKDISDQPQPEHQKYVRQNQDITLAALRPPAMPPRSQQRKRNLA